MSATAVADAPLDGPPPEDESLTRTPPNDVLAEQAVLGSALMSSDALANLIEAHLKGSDFYRPAHELIWAAMLEVQDSGRPVDALTVSARLQETGGLARVGGAVYLHTLMAATPTPANARYYADIVMERATLRRLVAAGSRITQLGYARDGGDLNTILSEAQSLITEAGAGQAETTVAPIGEVFEEVIDSADPALAPARDRGVRWGLASVDALVDPLEPGQFAVIAGWSGGGKTQAMITFARHAAFRQDKRVLIHSIEMSKKEIGRRIVAAEAGVSLTRMKRRELTEREWDRVFRAQARLQAAPLWIDDCESVTLPYLNSSIMRYDPECVYVDQIPIMIPPDPRVNREQQLDALSYGMKRMASARQVPICALAQLNRAPMARVDKKPTMRDLRGSDAISHAAHVVLLLHDPTMGEQDHERDGETDIIIGKQRDGISDRSIPVGNQAAFARFVDLHPGPGPEQGTLGDAA